MTSYHRAHLVDDPRRATIWRAIAAHLAPHIASGAHVVELGAGYCHWINHVHGARRVAVDMWDELPQHTAPGVEPMVADIAGGLSALTSGSFDVVLASNVLEHFQPDVAARAVETIGRLLRPGGRLILIQPNFRYSWRSYFDDYTHRSIFTDVSLPALLRATGFDILRVDPRFLPYSMQGTRVPINAWLVKAYLASPLKPAAGQMLVIAELASRTQTPQKDGAAHVR